MTYRSENTALQGLALSVCRQIAIFPCKADKSPATAHGFKDASRDPSNVARMFSRPWAALIGAPTGEINGFDVLDLDPKNGSADWHEENAAALVNSRTVQTRGGGIHVYFRHAAGMGCSASKIAPGVDVRGDGGYVILWRLHGGRLLRDLPIGAWPEWLRDEAIGATASNSAAPDRATAAANIVIPTRIQRQAGRTGADPRQQRAFEVIGRALFRVETAAAGNLHHTVRNAALLIGGLLDVAGFTESETAQALVAAAARAGAVDLRNAEITAAWGLARGRQTPITLGCRV